jgi:hypothetical protein
MSHQHHDNHGPNTPPHRGVPLRLSGAFALALLACQSACSAAHHPETAPPTAPTVASPMPPESALRGNASAVDVPHADPHTPVHDGAVTDPTPVQTPVDFERVQPQPPASPPVSTPDDRVAELERERAAIVERLVQTNRRLFDAAPSDQHGALLTELLADPVPELRALGLALVEGELADAEPIAPEVGVALARLLRSSESRVRIAAARLLNRLAQPGLERAIAEALDAETDPLAASELLAAAARQPQARLVQPMLRWLSNDLASREAAAQAGLALARANLLTPGDQHAAASTLRVVAPDTLSAPAIRLLALVGSREDRDTLRPLLTSQDPARRIAACESLSVDAAYVDDIVNAARSDPALLDVAVRAIAAHRPTLEGLALLQTLPFPNVESRRAATSQVTVGMDLSTLIMASDELMSRSPLFVEAILSNVADLPPTDDQAELLLRARALIRLAESYLAQSRPDRALALIDRVEPHAGSVSDFEVLRIERARTIALLWLDRLDDPSLASSNPDFWLDALVLMGSEPQGPDVSEALLARFAATLTDAQLARLRDIEARLLTGPRPESRALPDPPPQPANARPTGVPPRGPN